MLRSSIRILSVTALLATLATGTVVLTQRSAEPADAQAAPVAALVRGETRGRASVVLADAGDRHGAVVLNQRLALARSTNAAAAAARKAAEAQAARKQAAAVRAAAVAREAARRAELARAARNASRDPGGARAMIADFGWSSSQFSCLTRLWEKESNWNHRAENPSSGAYGIPQSLPGRKMASAGSDWRTNPVTQIRWGLGYIEDRFGTPCGAWAHSQSHGWY